MLLAIKCNHTSVKKLRLPDAHERARIMWKYLGCEHGFMQNACFWLSTNTPKYEHLLAVSNWKAVYTNREQYLLKEIILFSTQLVQICTQDSTAIPKAAGSRVWYWESSYFRWTETWRGEDPQKGYLETMDGWQKTYAESCFPQLFFSNSFRVGIFKCLAFLVP